MFFVSFFKSFSTMVLWYSSQTYHAQELPWQNRELRWKKIQKTKHMGVNIAIPTKAPSLIFKCILPRCLIWQITFAFTTQINIKLIVFRIESKNWKDKKTVSVGEQTKKILNKKNTKKLRWRKERERKTGNLLCRLDLSVHYRQLMPLMLLC